MFFRLLKITLFVGILLSSLAIVLARMLPPSKLVLIMLFYMIVLSSVASGFVVYYEIYLKPKRQMKKIFSVLNEAKAIKKQIEERASFNSSLILQSSQTSLLLENGIRKIEEKIEKIEKEVMDMSKC